MAHKFFLERRPHNGLTYSEYFESFRKKIETAEPANFSQEEKDLFEYSKLNFQRSSRIHKTYIVDSILIEALQKISEPQIWMVITEDWCGDSAQNLPYIAKIADCNPKIFLRIIPRDQNLDIMDLYLTNGNSRSIPKLIAFDMDGNELFQWGPRPLEAQKIVTMLKEEGKPKEEIIEQLHIWYGRNRGKALENEFKEIFGVK